MTGPQSELRTPPVQILWPSSGKCQPLPPCVPPRGPKRSVPSWNDSRSKCDVNHPLVQEEKTAWGISAAAHLDALGKRVDALPSCSPVGKKGPGPSQL